MIRAAGAAADAAYPNEWQGTVVEAIRQNAAGTANSNELSQLKRLQAVDTKVRAHEAAHIAAGGGLVRGGADFTYAKGSDGKFYAVGGEVAIDVSKEADPRKTASKMRQVVAAALAPADPSPQDYRVASNARVMEMNALLEYKEELAVAKQAKGAGIYAQQAIR